LSLNEFNFQFDQHLFAGHGNDDREWTNVAFAEKSGIDDKTISEYRNSDRVPNKSNFDKIQKVLFPNRVNRKDSELAGRFHKAWLAAKESARKSKTAVARIDLKAYSMRDMWKQMMRLKSNEFSTPVVGASDLSKVRFGGFANDELTLVHTNRKFFIPLTDELITRILDGEISYDINSEGKDFDECPISQLIPYINKFDIEDRIEHYRKLYAKRIIEAFTSTARYKPYNKKKLGVWNVSSHIPHDRDETTAATIETYETDYFTNWIMSHVLYDMRKEIPDWLDDLREYPSLNIDGKRIHLPQLTPSLGLNCVIISNTTIGTPKTCFSKLADGSSNDIQHQKVHLPVNEGLNIEDVDPNTGKPSIEIWWKRMLKEEMGADLKLNRFEFEAINVFIDHTVGEFGVFGVLTTDYSIGELNDIRNGARDAGREFHKGLIEVAATEYDVLDFVLDQPNSINSFVSYTPHLINTLVEKRILERVYTST